MSEETRVTVTDIHMPFWSIVGFMVKWTFATIPALIIIVSLALVIAAAFGGSLAVLGGMLR